MKRLLIYTAAMFMICSCGSDDEGTTPGGGGTGVGKTTVNLQNTWLQEDEITGGGANSTYSVVINKVGTREVKGTVATETELHEFYNVNYGTEYKLLDPKYYEIANGGAFTIGAEAGSTTVDVTIKAPEIVADLGYIDDYVIPLSMNVEGENIQAGKNKDKMLINVIITEAVVGFADNLYGERSLQLASSKDEMIALDLSPKVDFPNSDGLNIIYEVDESKSLEGYEALPAGSYTLPSATLEAGEQTKAVSLQIDRTKIKPYKLYYIALTMKTDDPGIGSHPTKGSTIIPVVLDDISGHYTANILNDQGQATSTRFQQFQVKYQYTTDDDIIIITNYSQWGPGADYENGYYSQSETLFMKLSLTEKSDAGRIYLAPVDGAGPLVYRDKLDPESMDSKFYIKEGKIYLVEKKIGGYNYWDDVNMKLDCTRSVATRIKSLVELYDEDIDRYLAGEVGTFPRE